MAVRNFNGTSDRLDVAAGAASAFAGTGAATIAALIKQQGTAGSLTAGVVTLNSSTQDQDALYAISGAPNWVMTASQTDGGGGSWSSTTTWYVIVVTKASGSQAPRHHIFPLGGAWSHAASVTSLAGGAAIGASGHVRFGNSPVDGFGNFRLAVAALWAANLSDAQCVELAANLKTSNWWNNSAGRPLALWEFNQASTATAVTDVTGGGADQSSIAGTSVVTTDDPPGWTFDGIGATGFWNQLRNFGPREPGLPVGPGSFAERRVAPPGTVGNLGTIRNSDTVKYGAALGSIRNTANYDGAALGAKSNTANYP